MTKVKQLPAGVAILSIVIVVHLMQNHVRQAFG